MEIKVCIERMGKDRIAKRVYVGNHLVGQLWKKWIDSVYDCLKKKKGFNVGQARRMMYNRKEWDRFVKGNASGIAHRMNP